MEKSRANPSLANACARAGSVLSLITHSCFGVMAMTHAHHPLVYKVRRQGPKSPNVPLNPQASSPLTDWCLNFFHFSFYL